MKLYFECNSGISGDMTVAALIDLGADTDKLKKTLESMGLGEEFEYKISDVMINAIKAKDFDVILKNHEHHREHEHHHNHRNLDDINKIIENAEMSENAAHLAKKIFKIIAEAESKVHNKDIKEIHFHEVGAVDSIVDIVSFAVLFDDLNPQAVYFSTLQEGQGTVQCQHGTLNIPVPAVCEIIKEYQIPIKITKTQGEMITPTGAGIVAGLQSIFNREKLEDEFIIEKIGCGAGKRKYENPILRVMQIK